MPRRYIKAVDSDGWIRSAVAASRLGVSRRTIAQMAADGRLRARRGGRACRLLFIDPASLAELAAAQPTGRPSTAAVRLEDVP